MPVFFTFSRQYEPEVIAGQFRSMMLLPFQSHLSLRRILEHDDVSPITATQLDSQIALVPSRGVLLNYCSHRLPLSFLDPYFDHHCAHQ